MDKSHLLEQLERNAKTLQVFREIGKALTSSLEIEQVLRGILKEVSELLNPSAWRLALWDPKAHGFLLEIVINHPDVDRNKIYGPKDGLIGWTGHHQKAVVLPDPSDERLYSPPDDVEFERCRSVLCVPLVVGNEGLGVLELEIHDESQDVFTLEQMEMVQVIADFAAIGILNAMNHRKIQDLTVTDDLTTLFNSRFLHKAIETEVSRAKRYKKAFSMVFLDMDHFKAVNDTHGHLYGSKLLQETAQIIQLSIRKVDLAARYGGDEFVLLLPETEKDDALRIAERIRETIDEFKFLHEEGIDAHLTASIGVATFPDDAQTKEDLIQLADDAMYKAKHKSKNRVESA